jgi:hypothetical protein
MTIATIADEETVENERSRTTKMNTYDHEPTFRDSLFFFQRRRYRRRRSYRQIREGQQQEYAR